MIVALAPGRSRLGRGLFPILISATAVACGERPLSPREPTPGVPHYRFATFNIAFPEAGDSATLEAVGAT
ncbi:MAG TPA: hypothetical protein VGP93_03325, partial [Polyangiaceae bacterium]|nr:hypothetical protein [Polyangiaceae bacterium]